MPSLKQKRASGTVQLVADVAAAGSCAAARVPVIALIYAPKKDFVGTDLVRVEIDNDNRTASLSYRITVGPQAEPLLAHEAAYGFSHSE